MTIFELHQWKDDLVTYEEFAQVALENDILRVSSEDHAQHVMFPSCARSAHEGEEYEEEEEDEEEESSEDSDTSSGSDSDTSSSSGPAVGPEGYVTADTPTDCVFFFGDSDIEYWNTTQDFPEAVNVGIGGATVEDAATHVQGVADCRPKGFVVFTSGENDFGYGETNVGRVFGFFKKVFRALNDSVHQPQIIYISTKPEPDTKELHGLYKKYDKLIRQYAHQLQQQAVQEGAPPPLLYIDCWTGFKDLGNPRNLYQSDGLHLTKKGYSYLVRWVKGAMAM